MFKPDRIFRHTGKVCSLRWWLVPKNNILNIYIHKFILVHGEYLEMVSDGMRILRKSFIPILRAPREFHRIELPGNKPAWSIFITGPKIRDWGFLTDNGWKHNSELMDKNGLFRITGE
jgi:hypothetical protein